MKIQIKFFSLICLISNSFGSLVKTWSPSSGLNIPTNWEDNVLPCASDGILFQSKSQEPDVVRLTDFSTKMIVLGENMAFLLDRNMKLQFKDKDSACSGNKIKKFKEIQEYYWISSFNWINEDILHNRAIPHEERLPCDNDLVVFPPNTTYEVNLQSTPYISFFRISLDAIQYTVNQFYEFLQTKIGQIVFKNSDNTLFLESQCILDNCPCHQERDALFEQLCENEMKGCQLPLCENPIQPVGHCCPICGALLHVNISNDRNFNFKEFKERTTEAISATNVVDINNIDYHMSIVMKNKHRFMQLIIIDKFEYNEESVSLMNFLKASEMKKISNDKQKFYFYSGAPYSPTESGHVFTFVFGTFFLVSMCMTLIYLFYYDDGHIRRLLAFVRNRQLIGNRDVIFARFDASSNLHEDGTESVVEVDLRYEEDPANSGFKNPMFEDKPEPDNPKLEEVELKE